MSVLNTKKKHNIWSVKLIDTITSSDKFNEQEHDKLIEAISSSNKFNEQEHDKLIAAITSSYSTEILVPNLSDSLVSYYKLDGDATDSHGSNDGTVYGATSVTGKINNCYSFDGVNDYINTGINSVSFQSGNFSVSAWVKTSGTSKHQTYMGIDMVETGNRGLFYFKKHIDDYFNFSVSNNSGGDSTATSSFIPNTTEWYHLVGVFDGVSVKLYINGNLEESVPFTGSIATATQDLTIGCGYFSDNKVDFVDGLIDEVGIWSRALTVSEVSELYNGGDGLAYSNMGLPVEV